MVGRVNKIATHICTFTGRTLWWGIKYGAAMTDPDAHPRHHLQGKVRMQQ